MIFTIGRGDGPHPGPHPGAGEVEPQSLAAVLPGSTCETPVAS